MYANGTFYDTCSSVASETTRVIACTPVIGVAQPPLEGRLFWP